jgi:regulator of protease activity HflC (stomatin/prohibitin superfamily)
VTYDSGQMTGIYKKARDLGGKACLAACFVFSACGCGPVTEIPQGHIGLLTRFGVYEAKLGAGLYTWNPVTESIQIIDIR